VLGNPNLVDILTSIGSQKEFDHQIMADIE
jgi:hypothetical protein